MLEKGFAHNDIKGDSVCIQVDNNAPKVTITELGLARRVGTTRIYQHTSDTDMFPWLAPELLLHTHPCGEASDVYSLAHLLKQSLPVRNKPGQRPSLAALRELMRRAHFVTPGKRPRLSAFTDLLQQMHEESTKGTKE
uniref:Protein kinase domain-containing protein n=1 Tax=Scylla olivacea TaxID=85551 RepID=A0A0P4VPT4_SCYOL